MRGAHQGGRSVAVGQLTMSRAAVRMLMASPMTVIKLGATQRGNKFTTLYTKSIKKIIPVIIITRNDAQGTVLVLIWPDTGYRVRPAIGYLAGFIVQNFNVC
jgi:hypothetical protein